MSGELTRRICHVSRGRPHTPTDYVVSVPEIDMAKLPAVSYDMQRVINEMHLSANLRKPETSGRTGVFSMDRSGQAGCEVCKAKAS